MEGLRLAIVGSRKVSDKGIVRKAIPDTTNIAEIISGGATGIDSLAAEFATSNNIPLCEIKPDYQRNGRGATFIRNRAIVDRCDALVAFWDGQSHGTKYTIDYAKKQGKSVTLILMSDEH